MTFNEAYIIAESHIKTHNEGLLKANYTFQLGVGEMIEFPHCYYFDFKFLEMNGAACAELPVAGAPGFIVSKADGHTETISHCDLTLLNYEEKRKDELFDLLLEIKEKNQGLFIIKNRYNLSSKQLMIFKNALKEASFDRTSADHLLNMLIKQIEDPA